jgi:hypothetical protein
MTRDDIHDLIIGAAVVALGYALYQHFKDRKAATPGAFAKIDPMNVDHGFGYDPMNPSDYISLADLLRGTVADSIYPAGAAAATRMPTTADLFGTVVAEQYGTDYEPQTGPYKAGALW